MSATTLIDIAVYHRATLVLFIHSIPFEPMSPRCHHYRASGHLAITDHYIGHAGALEPI